MGKVRRLYHPWRLVRHFDQAEGLAELRRKGLRTLEGPQVVLCSASECSAPIAPSASLVAEVAKFTSPGRSRGTAP